MTAESGENPEYPTWAAVNPGAGRRGLPAARLAAGVSPRACGLLAAVLVFAAACPAAGQAPPLPTLRIDAPASLEGVAAQVAQFPSDRLETAMSLSGLSSPGPPIDVLLIAEDSDLARGVPVWISGFADAARNVVVLFPERARNYPSNSLETLLHHEVAHILFSRAAQGRPVPRWFNEGLALAAERPAGLGDRSRLAWTLIRYGDVPLDDLERLFGEGQAANQRAYAVSSALVRDLLRTHGRPSAGRILAGISRGQPFEAAFEAATGRPLSVDVQRFWGRQRLWGRWIPFLTGPTFLWMVITSLALYSIHIHRRRRAEQRRLWDEEEQFETDRRATEQTDADL